MSDWVLVPKVATKEMIEAMSKTMPKKPDGYKWVSNDVKHLRRWQAALAAAPKPPAIKFPK